MAVLNVPKSHQAIIYDQPGHISTKIVNVDTPEPGPGEVLVNITHTGICHSDMNLMLNAWEFLSANPTQAGQVGGHEGVGSIVKFGPSCEGMDLKLGDRVGIKWIASACGNCPPCLAGADGICRKAQISGLSCPGTFQEYVLAPANYVTPIPEELASDVAAPLLCGGVTAYAALRKSGANPGDWVVVSGAGGGLGHLALQLGSRGMGYRMIGIDVGQKSAFMQSCGAEASIDITQFPLDENGPGITGEIMRLTGGEGAAAVVICSASNAAYGQALGFLKFNGVLVCVGVPGGKLTPIAGAYPSAMVAKQLSIRGSTVGNRSDALATLEMAKRGIVKTHISIEEMGNLDNVFKQMHAGTLQGRAVVGMSHSDLNGV